jgi:hypothetical protein
MSLILPSWTGFVIDRRQTRPATHSIFPTAHRSRAPKKKPATFVTGVFTGRLRGRGSGEGYASDVHDSGMTVRVRN